MFDASGQLGIILHATSHREDHWSPFLDRGGTYEAPSDVVAGEPLSVRHGHGSNPAQSLPPQDYYVALIRTRDMYA